ncbi:MAG: NAD-dependent dehydratase [Acidobacteria bacterium]|nr:MAG: NAD-dependent dehydratase [Acidobacteriota bacterium]
MKVLVTGGTGFVGSHLVRHLLAHGDEVVCLVRPTSRLDNLQGLTVKLARGDLSHPETLRSALEGCHTVYHCAADYRLWCKDPERMHATNVEGTRNVLQAAFEARVERVVYTSTVGCLGLEPDGSPANETTLVNFEKLIGPYKRSKFLAEREAENWFRRGLPVVIVNPSTPVGELDIKPTPTGKMIVGFLRGKMFGYVETGMNLVDVRDVAEGHILAAKKGMVGEKYILGHSNLTLKQIFDLLSKLTGIPSPTKQIPHWMAETYARLENYWSDKIRHREPFVPLEGAKLARHKMWFDASKAVNELGLPQTSIEEALRRAVKWFLDHGYVTSRRDKRG